MTTSHAGSCKSIANSSEPLDQLFQSARSLAERAMKGLIPNPIGNASEFVLTRIYFRDQSGRYPNQTEWERFTREYPVKARRIGNGSSLLILTDEKCRFH